MQSSAKHLACLVRLLTLRQHARCFAPLCMTVQQKSPPHIVRGAFLFNKKLQKIIDLQRRFGGRLVFFLFYFNRRNSFCVQQTNLGGVLGGLHRVFHQ